MKYLKQPRMLPSTELKVSVEQKVPFLFLIYFRGPPHRPALVRLKMVLQEINHRWSLRGSEVLVLLAEEKYQI